MVVEKVVVAIVLFVDWCLVVPVDGTIDSQATWLVFGGWARRRYDNGVAPYGRLPYVVLHLISRCWN